MIAKRIIPCLDVRDGRVVKGVQFAGMRDVASPVALAKFYNECGADELVFYDITASFEGRALFADALESVAKEVFLPLCVGGGIRTVDDFSRALHSGADKVSINTAALNTPELIDAGARRYGSQCVVLSMDVKRENGVFCVYSHGGRQNTGREAVAWACEAVDRGAGELVINSIDTDGVKQGFDLPLLQAIAQRVHVPVIASGGAGSAQHVIELFQAVPQVDAGLAASIFHMGEVKIHALKRQLAQAGIPVRLDGFEEGEETQC